MKQFLHSKGLWVGMLLTCYYSLAAQEAAHTRQTSPSHTVGQAAVSLKDLLKTLKDRYQVDFLYEDQTVEGYTVTSNVDLSGQSLEITLNKVLKSFGLRYKKVRNNTYLIQKAKPDKKLASTRIEALTFPSDSQSVLQASIPASVQNQFVSETAAVTVTGKVTDEKNQPMPGVTVLEKGTTNGTTTDAGGNYKLTVAENATLVFSFIGYVPEETALNNRNAIDMTLLPDIKSLTEVVVIGYVRRSGKTFPVQSAQLKATIW